MQDIEKIIVFQNNIQYVTQEQSLTQLCLHLKSSIPFLSFHPSTGRGENLYTLGNDFFSSFRFFKEEVAKERPKLLT